MIGVKNGQFIQGGLKVRLDEMGVGDSLFCHISPQLFYWTAVNKICYQVCIIFSKGDITSG